MAQTLQWFVASSATVRLRLFTTPLVYSPTPMSRMRTSNSVVAYFY